MIFEDATKAVTNDVNGSDKCQKHQHLLKLVVEAVLICSEQDIAFRGHRAQVDDSETLYGKIKKIKKAFW